MTNRIEDYDEGVLLDNKRISAASFDWQQILEKYEIKTLLLDRSYDSALLEAALDSGAWQQVYQNDQSIILVLDNQ